MPKCAGCNKPAEYKVGWNNGSAYMNTCMEHIPVGSNVISIVF